MKQNIGGWLQTTGGAWVLWGRNDGKVEKMRAIGRGPSKNFGAFIRAQKQRGELVEGDGHVCTVGGGKDFSHIVSEQGQPV